MERVRAIGRVVCAGGVLKERLIATRRVLAPSGIEIERTVTKRGITRAGGITEERLGTKRGITKAAGITQECLVTISRILRLHLRRAVVDAIPLEFAQLRQIQLSVLRAGGQNDGAALNRSSAIQFDGRR